MHNLEIINGEASMFYSGEKPWHGLGVKLDKPATSLEAISAAKLDWQVEKQQLYLPNNDPALNTFATIRTDQNKILGIAATIEDARQFVPDGAHEYLYEVHGVILSKDIRNRVLETGFPAWGN